MLDLVTTGLKKDLGGSLVIILPPSEGVPAAACFAGGDSLARHTGLLTLP
jgi:hypothetical protein